jgi:hypothetical protein
MAEPQEEFRAELTSLRRSVIRSIQQAIPSNVAEGLEIYQRLLNQILRRFNLLYEGRARGYGRGLDLAGTNGSQMEWLRSDYQDFVEQALNSGSLPVRMCESW